LSLLSFPLFVTIYSKNEHNVKRTNYFRTNQSTQDKTHPSKAKRHVRKFEKDPTWLKQGSFW